MKRILTILVCLMLVFVNVPSLATDATALLGDVTGDGVLNNEDVWSLSEYIAGYTKTVAAYDESKLALADVNEDGKISSADLLELTKLIPDYTPEKKAGPVILLKCDDLKSNDLDAIIAFENFYSLFQEEGVTASFGIVGNSASSGNQTRFWSDVNTFIDGGIEIWSHGWLHRKNDAGQAEFNGMLTYDEMKENFQKVLDLVSSKANGYQITCFGPPYNQMSAECATMLNEDFPQITSVFFTSKDTNAVRITSKFDLEGGAITLENFKTLYNSRAESDYYAIQMHPANYDENELAELRKIIKFLKGQNCRFMTPSQYVEYVNSKAN